MDTCTSRWIVVLGVAVAAAMPAPAQTTDLDEIVETTTRFLLSVLSYSSVNTASDAKLRAYLQRTLAPALGLQPSIERIHR